MIDLPRLKTMLDTPELAWMIRRLRRRYEQGSFDLTRPLTLQNATAQQREACDRLLGRKPTTGNALTVRPDQIERLLIDAQLADNLRESLEAIGGQLLDLRAAHLHVQSEWRNLFERSRSRIEGDSIRCAWLDELSARGILRRLSNNDLDQAIRLMDRSIDVVHRLPAEGVTLAQLAAETCGDSHALDHGQPLSTLVIRAAVRLGDSALPHSAQERRRVWDRVGVVCDELSSPVLALNLIADERSFTGRLLRLSAAEGEPCRITSRQLLRHPPQFDPTSLGERVYVCENPSVLAAAANALGRACPPMVCIDGQPTTAAHLLLTALTRAKLTLWYHGDFDWGGLRIANLMRARYDAHPWRMSTADYLVADSGRGVKLNARAVNAAWDSDLMTAMLQRGFAVHEEQVQGVLIDDLRKTVTIGTNSASAV